MNVENNRTHIAIGAALKARCSHDNESWAAVFS